jgi:hypothetical protein
MRMKILEHVVVFQDVWLQHHQPMKIRGSIYFLAVFAAVLLVFLLLGRRSEMLPPITGTNITAAFAGQSTKTSTNVVNQPSFARGSNITMSARNQPNSPRARLASSQGRAALLQEILDANDAEIEFYGHLEDQFNNPVALAQVTFAIQYENSRDRGIKRGQAVSDDKGLFTISGFTGADLTVTPSKPGYALATTDTSFRYTQISPGYFVPDANNPTIIKMWKFQGVQPLVAINKTYKLPYTSEPIFFDFVSGNVVPRGGDLEVIITRAPGVITQRNRGDWSINFLAVNGGIAETDQQAAQVTFEAPADGYQNSYVVQMNHDQPKWYDNIQREFFLRSRNGQVYGKFYLDFGINDDANGTMWFQFKGVANAEASRNWEINPN